MGLKQYIPKVFLPPLEVPQIESFGETTHRPFWSVMIPTYNRAKFVERTLKSILDQDPGRGEMQIEVVDDCSPTEDIEAVVKQVGKGRVNFYRQPENKGLAGNWNECIRRAQGHYVHIIHDDDMVMSGFYAEYRRFIESHSDVVLVFCRAVGIDEDDQWLRILWSPPDWKSGESGIWEDALYHLVIRDYIVCPTVVVARSAYERVGGYVSQLRYALDWEMWLRLACIGPVGYIHRPLYLYRMHQDAETNRLAVSGRNIQEIVFTGELGASLLPSQVQQSALSKARANAAVDALYFRQQLHYKGQALAAMYYALWAMKLQPSLRNSLNVTMSFLRLGKSKLFSTNR